MTLKMAVFAPMPSASVRMAIALNPGLRFSRRNAYRTSCWNSSNRVLLAMSLPGNPSLPNRYVRRGSAAWRLSPASVAHHFEADHAGNDQGDAEQSRERGGFLEQPDAE